MEVLKQECSQPPILPSPHFRWVVKRRVYQCCDCSDTHIINLYRQDYDRHVLEHLKQSEHCVIFTTMGISLILIEAAHAGKLLG